MVFSATDDGRTTVPGIFQQKEGAPPRNPLRHGNRMDVEAMREAAGFPADGA